MALVDSEVVFKARCNEIGLAGTTFDELKRRGWNTFGNFAFSVSTNPGQVTDRDFETKIAAPVLGDAAHVDAPKLRRLLFESYTMTASELKRKVDNNETDAPKKLPVQEVASRFASLQAKLDPIRIESVMEPSHQLINLIAQCLEDGRVRYIEWSRCTTRSSEVNNLKETESLKVWKADASGVIKQTSPDDALKCDASTELEILNAMKRRGVAYELAKVMSFEKHEMIINLLFQELQREAPVGFKKVSMEQVASADREIHLKLAEKKRAGLPLGPAGELPLDVHLDDVLALPSVMWLLMPKPRTTAEKTVHIKEIEKSRQNEDKDDNPKKKKAKKAKLNDKRIGKMPMPAKLRGGTPVDGDGKSICFGYNLGTCHEKQCKKGRHVCCHAGCFNPGHTFLNHGKAQ